MVFFNWATMQMAAKIVYYGPGLCGKTTNLSFIYAKTAPGSRGEMVSLETETDRTLFFDLLPIEVGKVGGFRTRLQLYTVPGQVFYNTTRKLVLKGVDGVVFVADSQRPMIDANVESLKNLDENLGELGLSVANMPLVLQFNKRDLKNILTVEEMNQALNPDGKFEGFESCAVDGTGVFETLKAITKLTLKSLRRRMATQDSTAAVPIPSSPGPRPAASAQPKPASASPVTFNPAALRSAAAEGLSSPVAKPSPPPPPDFRPSTVPSHLKPYMPSPPTPVPVETALPQDAEDVVETLAPVEVLEQPEEVLETPIEELPAPEEVTELKVAALTEEMEEAPAEAVEEVVAELPEVPPVETSTVAGEEPEEAVVEFATTEEPEAVAAAPEVRHVKVSSSLDILAELETLRKSSTMNPGTRPVVSAAKQTFDLDALLQGSLNSRQEVKRRVDEKVGRSLLKASRCTINIQLVDANGKPLREVTPVEVEINRGDKVRHLALTLIVNLHGE
jgi:mutual gliding-motility protein MglA